VTNDPASGAPPGRDDLRRKLGLADAVAIFVGIILGSGIFVAPSDVAAAAPGWGSATLLWLVAGFVAACGAFCYAECGARLPRTGGFYVFYREVYGDAVAFVGGWAALLITYPASIAAIADIFARYLAEAIPGLPEESRPVAAAAVLLAGFLNAVGVRSGAWAQRVLTVGKVVALATLCLAAVVVPGSGAEAPATLDPFAVTSDFATLILALVVVLWTYDGWSDVTLVSGELRRPGRNLGRAVLLGIVVLVALYASVQLAVGTLLPPERAASSGRVLSDAVEVGLGEGFGRFVALLIVVSTMGSINGIVLTASRLGYAMARDGVFLRWFGRVHPRWETPARSLGLLVAATLVYTATSTFDDLLTLFSFAVWIFYALTAIALVRLRRRRVGEPLEWKAPGGWTAPAVLLIVAAAMTSGLAIRSPVTALQGTVLLAIGFPIYALWTRLFRR
jgi:APA family basic amino acid/polyamine antiporter